MIIDAHGHLAANPRDLDEIVEGGIIEQVWLLDVSFYNKNISNLFADRSEILEVSKRYSGFFIPFAFLDFSRPVTYIDQLKEQGFKGLKAIRPLFQYDHESYFGHYERAAKLKMPIVFHTGIILTDTREALVDNVSVNSSNMRPSYLTGIASAFPDLPLIAAHLGIMWGEEAYMASRICPNVYTDISGGCFDVKLRWLDNYLSKGVGNKVLMGIDAVYGRREYHKDILRAIEFWNLYFDFVIKKSDAYQYKNRIFAETARNIGKYFFTA